MEHFPSFLRRVNALLRVWPRFRPALDPADLHPVPYQRDGVEQRSVSTAQSFPPEPVVTPQSELSQYPSPGGRVTTVHF